MKNIIPALAILYDIVLVVVVGALIWQTGSFWPIVMMLFITWRIRYDDAK